MLQQAFYTNLLVIFTTSYLFTGAGVLTACVLQI